MAATRRRPPLNWNDPPDMSDRSTARAIERSYSSPEIAHQRFETLRALNAGAGERILDAGCGPGLLTAALAMQVGETGRVLGVDRDPEMLAVAAERCRSLPAVELREADITRLDAGDGAFDAASCTQVLLYVEDVPAMLAAFRRMLRPGGRPRR
jgi:arsenite methyltransferase